MAYQIEVTDTFGGAANYCWVRRAVVGEGRESLSRRTLIQKTKELAGWDGWCRVNVADFGDMLQIEPAASSGIPQIAFVTWMDNENG